METMLMIMWNIIRSKQTQLVQIKGWWVCYHLSAEGCFKIPISNDAILIFSDQFVLSIYTLSGN